MKFNTYPIAEGHLDRIDEALDVLTMAYHACIYAEETGKGVSPAVIASAISMARNTISDIMDDVRMEAAV